MTKKLPHQPDGVHQTSVQNDEMSVQTNNSTPSVQTNNATVVAQPGETIVGPPGAVEVVFQYVGVTMNGIAVDF
jgi:hypothetical protein